MVTITPYTINPNHQNQSALEVEMSRDKVQPTLQRQCCYRCCFPQSHPLHRILNKNTIKLSYSCMPNMHNVISAHNKAVFSKQPQLNDTNNSKSKECNCRQKDSCPLSSKCLTDSVVYQATVTRDDTTEENTYVGHTEGEFKTRYNNHTNSFRNAKHKHATALSKYVWHLKCELFD